VTTTIITSHILEPWTMAFSPDSSLIFSGGDDAVLQCTPFKAEGTDDGTVAPLWSDRRIHQAGVTAILPVGDQLLITGSYDDHIRLISAPPTGRRQALSELNLSGGVWRLKMLGSSFGKNGNGTNHEGTEHESPDM
jgi:diphthamide biosynthesis protein 7